MKKIKGTLRQIFSIKYNGQEQKDRAQEHLDLFASNPQCSMEDLPDTKEILKIILDLESRIFCQGGIRPTQKDIAEAISKRLRQ